MSIDCTAATGYARAASEYERGRPDYPDAVVDRLVAGLPGRNVVDLAAGTGKLTQALVARRCHVVAVEPIAEMRARIKAPARARDGTAEDTGLPAGSADAVTVAQAFHWFDGPRALAEIHRILRPDGVLALVWNRRQKGDPLQDQLSVLLEPHRHGGPPHRQGRWRAAFQISPLFDPLSEESFVNEQLVDAAGLADRIGSISFVAALGERERATLLDQARALAGNGVVVLRYVVELQLTTRRDR